MTKRPEKQELKNSSIDHVTSVVKGAIGVVPFAGPLLAEIAGTLIPNQRIDRLVKFSGYTDLMVDGAPLPHQPDTIIRWLIDRPRS